MRFHPWTGGDATQRGRTATAAAAKWARGRTAAALASAGPARPQLFPGPTHRAASMGKEEEEEEEAAPVVPRRHRADGDSTDQGDRPAGGFAEMTFEDGISSRPRWSEEAYGFDDDSTAAGAQGRGEAEGAGAGSVAAGAGGSERVGDGNRGKEGGRCRHPPHRRHYRPTCNDVHGIDLGSGVGPGGDIIHLGLGGFRTTFRIPAGGGGKTSTSSYAAFKMVTESGGAVEDYAGTAFLELMEMQRHDAMVMDLLSASPRISDLHSFCGMASVNELGADEMESVILTDPDENEPPPLDEAVPFAGTANGLGVLERLSLALEFARPLADLHGYRGGVLAHVDVKPDQYMRGRDGIVKLVDFNRAEVLPYLERDPGGSGAAGGDDDYCRVDVGTAPTIYRSPEELAALPIDESSDVYNYASLVAYTVLTGRWIHSVAEEGQGEGRDLVADLLLTGHRPFYDVRFRRNSYGEACLCRVLEECLDPDRSARADIFWVVRYLEEALERQAELDSRGMGGADGVGEWARYVYRGDRIRSERFVAGGMADPADSVWVRRQVRLGEREDGDSYEDEDDDGEGEEEY